MRAQKAEAPGELVAEKDQNLARRATPGKNVQRFRNMVRKVLKTAARPLVTW